MRRTDSLRRAAALPGLAALVAVLGFAHVAAAQKLVAPLETGFEPLRADFNQGSGSPRLVVVLSPT